MNILILNWKDTKNPEMGGAEIILYEIGKRLIRDGHQVTWFSRKFDNCLPEENIEGMKIIRRGNKLSVYFEAFRYYKNLKIKPDKVLDCLNTVAWQTPLYVPIEKRVFYVNQLAKEVFFYEFPPVLSQIAYFLERFQFLTYKNTKTICYAKSTKDDLVSWGIPESNISIFPLGLDHNRYKPSRKSKDPLFVFVARLVRMKRADMCVKAMKDVVEKYPKAKLAIIGYGKEEKNIENLINKLKLENNVFLVNKDNVFLEKHEKDVKVKLLQEAWALLLPSVKEGWGMVVTEAAACGTTAIVSDVTGLRDSVIDGKTGVLLKNNNDVGHLSYQIVNLITNSKLRVVLSKNSIEWSNILTWDRCYDKLCKLFL